MKYFEGVLRIRVAIKYKSFYICRSVKFSDKNEFHIFILNEFLFQAIYNISCLRFLRIKIAKEINFIISFIFLKILYLDFLYLELSPNENKSTAFVLF